MNCVYFFFIPNLFRSVASEISVHCFVTFFVQNIFLLEKLTQVNLALYLHERKILMRKAAFEELLTSHGVFSGSFMLSCALLTFVALVCLLDGCCVFLLFVPHTS